MVSVLIALLGIFALVLLQNLTHVRLALLLRFMIQSALCVLQDLPVITLRSSLFHVLPVLTAQMALLPVILALLASAVHIKMSSPFLACLENLAMKTQPFVLIAHLV
jgi:hypothetical protein